MLPELHTAAVALLTYHLAAPHLRRGQSKAFHARWTEGVLKHILDPTDTCLGRTGEGLQCNEHVPEGEISGLCLGHRHVTLLEESELEEGCAHEALCQVCYQNFEDDDAVACLMCFQKIHRVGCWDALFKGVGLETPKTADVAAVLCGLCACLRTTIFTILWEAGTPGKVHLMPPTEEQIIRSMEIAGDPWLEECYQLLCAEVNSDVPTPDYLVAMSERRKQRRQQGGFKKHTTPVKRLRGGCPSQLSRRPSQWRASVLSHWTWRRASVLLHRPEIAGVTVTTGR